MGKRSPFIESLVDDLANPSPSRNFGSRYALYWAAWAAFVAVVTFALNFAWPDWLRPPADVFEFGFVARTALYVIATAVFARFAYLNSVPCFELAIWRLIAIATLLAAAVGILILSPVDPRGWAAEFCAELDWAVGPCGFFIAIMAFVVGGALRVAARRGHASRPRAAAGWTFAAAAALASTSAEILCRHESPTHMVLWHFVPFAIVTAAGGAFAGRIGKTKKEM